MGNFTGDLCAGLAFLGEKNFDIVKIGNRVCATLDALDEPVTGMRILSDESALVRSQDFDMRINLEADRELPNIAQRATNYLAITLVTRPDQAALDEKTRLSVLAHSLKTLDDLLVAEYVQWIDPRAVLTGIDFRMATRVTDESNRMPEEEPMADLSLDTKSTVMPRRTSLPDIEHTNDILQARLSETEGIREIDETESILKRVFRTDEHGNPTLAIPTEEIREENDRLRLSVWLMTFTLGLFALPVAAALIVINLLRGENLRLTSQTAALTGTFLALQTSGATAQVLSMFQNVIS